MYTETMPSPWSTVTTTPSSVVVCTSVTLPFAIDSTGAFSVAAKSTPLCVFHMLSDGIYTSEANEDSLIRLPFATGKPNFMGSTSASVRGGLSTGSSTGLPSVGVSTGSSIGASIGTSTSPPRESTTASVTVAAITSVLTIATVQAMILFFFSSLALPEPE